MTEAERALRSVLDAAHAAGADAPRELNVGPIPMTVQSDDPALLDQTVAHAAGEPGPDAWRPLRVLLATDRTVALADLPAPLRPPSDHSQGTTIVRAGDLTAVVGDGMTWIVDDATGTAMRWTATAADVPIWEANRPLRVALRWWGARHGAGLLHAAAVGRDGRALLLVGAGGAGKSTTAYSCLGRGLQVLGDDYCLVRPDEHGSVTAFATYRLGNLGEGSLLMLPWLRDRVVGMGHQGKAIVPMDPLPTGEGRAEVVGIAAVVQSPGAATRLVPHSSMGVLRRLGPNTVSQIAGWSRETLAVCTAVVSAVPTYEFHVAEPASAAPVLADHLGQTA